MFGGGAGGGPAKGILKKTSSNPNLAALDSLNVVDIRKYLKDRDDRELRGGDGGGGGDDGAERERADSPATSVLSEMTTATEPASGQRMYRALSGQSLPDMEVYQARASQQNQVCQRVSWKCRPRPSIGNCTIPFFSPQTGVDRRPAGKTLDQRDSPATSRIRSRRTSRRRSGHLEQSIRTSTR